MRKLFDISGEQNKATIKLNEIHPYKIQLRQELSDCDFDRSVEFCEIMRDMIRKKRNVSMMNVAFT